MNQLDLINCPQKDYRGYHVLLDYHFKLKHLTHETNQKLAKQVIKILENSCHNNNVNIVHKKLVILPGDESPAGFTSVILIDESHLTAHCYAQIGLLAIDVFSCGGNSSKTIKIANDVHNGIEALDDLKQIKFLRLDCPRFPYKLKKCGGRKTSSQILFT